ncbi:MAG: hypothetical protein ACHQT8_05625 [Chlamydiales bacterium]
MKRTMGALVFIIGLLMLGGSFYIKSQVLAGREQISSAQKNVDNGKSLFSLSPYTKDAGDLMAGSVQKKIDAGTAEANRYEQIACWLKIGGIVFMVAGAGIFLLGRKK